VDTLSVYLVGVLTDRQAAFVREYCVDFNATKAYIRAGYSEGGAGTGASLLLDNPKVQAAIEVQKERLLAKFDATVEFVLREWIDIATADPRELVQSRVGCCRYCWGLNHKREWMEHEYSTALNDALRNNFLPPDFEGGLGYSPTREPNAECPKCKGEGIPRTVIADSRHLSRKAAKLYAGVKQTRDGIEIKMRDQDKARDNIARYLGMLVERKELSGPNSGPIEISASTRPRELSDDQLEALILATAPPLLLEGEKL
jgi:phage terminase small subunit